MDAGDRDPERSDDAGSTVAALRPKLFGHSAGASPATAGPRARAPRSVLAGHPSAIRDALPSASHHLPRVGLFKPKGVRDVAVSIVERFPKDVIGSFGGRQLLQQ